MPDYRKELVISGRLNTKPWALLLFKPGRDSHICGDSWFYKTVCVLGMNPGHHTSYT